MIQRYQDLEIAEIFSDESRIAKWAQVELELMREQGHDPGDTVLPNMQMIELEEATSRHDVVAFLTAWVKVNPNNEILHQWVHFGLTSSNVVDSALALQLLEAHRVVNERLLELTQLVALIAVERDKVTQIGRTHGQYSVPRSGGIPWAMHRDVLVRMRQRLGTHTAGIGLGNLAGPAGDTTAIDANIEYRTIRKLGLRGTTATTQLIPRDSIASWAQFVALLATQCEAIATQVWLLTQSGVEEVAEGRTSDQIGSSAMPHKRNPIMSENICGLARMARSMVEPLVLGLVQWGDHDLRHSSVERVFIPDLCHLVVTALRRTQTMLLGLTWNEYNHEFNLGRAVVDGSTTHNELLNRVTAGQDYLAAHREIRERKNQ